jgi:glycosyltransferase involved in cell wall biosynthesis
MRIAQIAPLYESVPPHLYGGTERVVHYLTEELVRQGHEVTLFASGDSVTHARLVAPHPRAVRLDPACPDPVAVHFLLLEAVFRDVADFDILHFHIDYLHFPLSRRVAELHLTTMHGRLDLPEHVRLYRSYPELPLVSISHAQRASLEGVNWQGTVHHGLPPDLLQQGNGSGGYAAFVGRVSPEKGVDKAIDIAQRAGIHLKIAAKVQACDREYFDSRIVPLLKADGVEFIGEIDEAEKAGFLGNARVLLFPIDWPEPFGLVMIESLACGTPVVAFRQGSVEEIVEDGINGFVVDDADQAIAALRRIDEIDRSICRRTFDARFSVGRMTADYVAIYEQLRAVKPPVSIHTSGMRRVGSYRG